jgi:hypothetical protein
MNTEDERPTDAKDERPKAPKAKLPESWPKLGDSVAVHALWVSKATCHEVVGAWRPTRGDNAPLVIRLGDGREVAFDSISEACRPERFIAAFLGIAGVVMPAYSGPQVREIVGALVRMARVDRESDELDEVRDIGARYLVACMVRSEVIEVGLDVPGGEYRAAIRLGLATQHLSGDDPLEHLPPVVYAPDREQMFVLRGLFGKFARRALMTPMTRLAFNGQMVRVGWVPVNWRPRKPGDRDAYRPNARVWQIPVGWEGVSPWDPPSFDESPENTGGT